MQSQQRFSTSLERLVAWLGALALCALGLLICAAVGLRLTGAVIKGNAEIGEMLIIVVASASLVTATFSSTHPHVHMLVDRLAEKWRHRLAASIAAAAALFWSVAAWVNGRVAIENSRLVEETELLRISLTPFRFVWVTALAVIAITLAARAIRSSRAGRSNREH